MSKNQRIAVIGDIHACPKSLEALLKALPKVDKIYQVGDLLDRGPDPKNVFRLVKEHRIACVLGNHEWLCLTGYQKHLPHYESWMLNGGEETLRQYQDPAELAAMVDVIKGFPLYFDLPPMPELGPERILITHAGIKRGLQISESIDFLHSSNANHIMSSLLWNRSKIFLKNYYQITGHTPISKPLVEAWGANIDTGCVFRNTMTAMILPEKEIIQVPFQDH